MWHIFTELTYLLLFLFHAVQPVIQFGSELQPCSPQDLAAAMGVQCNAASLPTVATMQNPKAMDTTDESTSANTQPVDGRSDRAKKRKNAPDSQMEDKVHFPAYLFRPPPSRLNTDHLGKLLMISEICKNYAMLNVFEHLINLFGFVKQYLVESCSGHKDDSRIYRDTDHGYAITRVEDLVWNRNTQTFYFSLQKITSLPPEVIGLILQYPSHEDILTFGAACDQTLNAIKLGNLWECTDMADFGVVSSYHRYNILSSVSWYVKDFTMKHQSFVYLHTSIVPGLTASFANIQKLDLTGAFNVHTLKFLQHTSKLVTLIIDGCTRICRCPIRGDINKCPSISHLGMANLNQLTHHDLREGLKSLKSLHFLDIMGTDNCPPAFVIALLKFQPKNADLLFLIIFFYAGYGTLGQFSVRGTQTQDISSVYL